jgi:hypothetical protein
MDNFDQILDEIYNIKRNTKFVFDDIFLRYSIPESEKFSLYSRLMAMLSGYVEIQAGYESNGFAEIMSRYKNSMVGLPYTLPHRKIR